MFINIHMHVMINFPLNDASGFGIDFQEFMILRALYKCIGFDLVESTTVLEYVIATLRCGVGYVMLCHLFISSGIVDSVLE